MGSIWWSFRRLGEAAVNARRLQQRTSDVGDDRPIRLALRPRFLPPAISHEVGPFLLPLRQRPPFEQSPLFVMPDSAPSRDTSVPSCFLSSRAIDFRKWKV